MKSDIRKKGMATLITKNLCHLLKRENCNKTEKSEENRKKNFMLRCSPQKNNRNLPLVSPRLPISPKFPLLKKTQRARQDSNVRRSESH